MLKNMHEASPLPSWNMPLFYLRRLTGSQRTESANRHLARFLAFIAGAANAGGLLAVGQYTSHMSGIVSAMADNLALGSVEAVLSGISAVSSFLAGAFVTTLLVRWARARGLDSEYALPLIVEAALLVAFGLTGRVFVVGHFFLDTVMLLCFTMGLQNAIITKISDAVIRTTHLTGMVTDMGISLGRIATMWRKSDAELGPDFAKLRLHASLIGLFFAGGVTGALGFRRVGFLFTLPLAAVLLLLAVMPIIEDVRRLRASAV
jgi:uncharacterized membrane protein YoaK (UPF0700 family)